MSAILEGQLRHDYAAPPDFPELPYNRAARAIRNAFQASEIIPYANTRQGVIEWCPIQAACAEAIGNHPGAEDLLAEILKIDHPAIKQLSEAAARYWVRQHATELAELMD
ncbi:MAG TPA: hypothetical protein VMA55_18890 [Acidovorax sp.]|nr:hypothetical protein [Acidovorax sp.]